MCSVHPGRTLELTTTIGIAKLKNVLQESMDSPPLHYGSTFIQQRSRLKSGRSVKTLSLKLSLGFLNLLQNDISLIEFQVYSNGNHIHLDLNKILIRLV